MMKLKLGMLRSTEEFSFIRLLFTTRLISRILATKKHKKLNNSRTYLRFLCFLWLKTFGRSSSFHIVLMMMRVFIMTSQNIKPEIAIKVSPDGMYVISATLCVVVFNQERGGLNPVIV